MDENCDFCEKALLSANDEELMLSEVIRGDHELFFLDAILGETLRC